jgi:hypothetical protein
MLIKYGLVQVSTLFDLNFSLRSRKTCLTFITSFLLMFLLFSSEALAATYYVSPTGNDGNSGSRDAPFMSIQKAADIVNPGDTVIVTDGVYKDMNSDGIIVIVRRGGSSGNYVTFKAEHKWGAVLDGQNNKAGFGFSIADSVSYIKIQDFVIKGVSGTAIIANPLTAQGTISFIEVYRNKIYDIARKTFPCDGYQNYGHCAIYGSTYTHHWTIDSNISWNVGRLQGGLVGTSCPPYDDWVHDHFVYIGFGTSPSVNSHDWTITNNIYYSGSSADLHNAGFFVAIGPYTHNLSIINNTVIGHNYNSAQYGVIFMNGDIVNMTVQNNIFYDTQNAIIQNLYESASAQNLVINNNLTTEANIFGYYGDVQTPYTGSGNILVSNPLFVDYASKDFYLTSGSPAIDTGLAFPGRTVDADGNSIVGAPDIGAYEYVSGQTLPPPADTTPPAPPTVIGVQ